MNRRSLLRNLMVAGAGSVLERLRAGDDSGDFVIHSEVRLVLLDVSVRDQHGAPVSQLTQADFTVFEDGRPQTIKVFDHDDRPVTLGILVDESRSMIPKRAAVLTAAEALMAESNPDDEIFVINFNETVTAGLPPDMPFSHDIRELHQALLRGIPQGRTALNDAVVAGLGQLRLGRHAKKTLVLISDGGDNASTHTRRETIAAVERDIATIYSIGVFDEDDPDRDPGLLRQLAHISGGDAFFPPSAADTMPICHGIARDIRARYTVGYFPQGSATGLRHIQVRASAPGRGKLTTRTRTSYLYEDETKNGDDKKNRR